jgi:carboxypeptidase family protein
MGYTPRQSSDVQCRRAATLGAVVAALTLTATAALAQQSVGAAIDSTILRLAVDDSATGQPISGARVELYSLSTVRRSDDLGRATFLGVKIGYQRVRVSAIGYQPVNRIIAVSAASVGDSTATLIDLEPTAQVLDTMTATASRRLSRTTKLDAGGFDMRRKMGLGHFLDADLIDAEAWRSSLGDMIAEHTPGIRNDSRRGHVYSTRSLAECFLDVYVDGIHQSAAFKLDDLDPESFAGVEIYSATTAPVQFKTMATQNSAGSPGCGVLVLWSRY